jgi:hypothetical protein
MTAILPRFAHDRRALAHTLWRLSATLLGHRDVG